MMTQLSAQNEQLQYLKDEFLVQGILFSDPTFLILTEGTIYQYDSERHYMNGSVPKTILNLLNFNVENHKDNVLILQHSKIENETHVYYSPRQDQIKTWYQTIKTSQNKYYDFLKNVTSRNQIVIPFSEMPLVYTVDINN